MSYKEIPNAENESNPERALSREQIMEELLVRIMSSHEKFQIKVERELSNAEGIYLLEVLSPDTGRRYVYQRKGSFEGSGQKIESSGTTIRSEDLDDGYSRTIADYDPIAGRWINQ
jgi:hypothetical protein